MGQIDVSELMADPDFVDALALIRRESVVDDFGKNIIRESKIQTVGCIQPISGKTLQRLPEAMRVVDSQSFWIKGKLVTDGNGRYSDLIESKGKRFTIQTVFDWSDWGEGWSEGICVREKP
jgi:hypothetical protein